MGEVYLDFKGVHFWANQTNNNNNNNAYVGKSVAWSNAYLQLKYLQYFTATQLKQFSLIKSVLPPSSRMIEGYWDFKEVRILANQKMFNNAFNSKPVVIIWHICF